MITTGTYFGGGSVSQQNHSNIDVSLGRFPKNADQLRSIKYGPHPRGEFSAALFQAWEYSHQAFLCCRMAPLAPRPSTSWDVGWQLLVVSLPVTRCGWCFQETAAESMQVTGGMAATWVEHGRSPTGQVPDRIKATTQLWERNEKSTTDTGS